MADIVYNGETVESPERLLYLLRHIDDQQFEYFVADLWEEMGWETTVRQYTRDKGVDVEAFRDLPYARLELIQAKRYDENSTVGSPDIQQYAALPEQEEKGDDVVVVTTGDFSSQAKDLAQRLDVKMVNGADLADLVLKADAQHIVAAYIQEVTVKEPAYAAISPDTRVSKTEAEAREAQEMWSHWAIIILVATVGYALLFLMTPLSTTESGFMTMSFMTVFLVSYIAMIMGIAFDYPRLDDLHDLEEPRGLYLVLALTFILAIAAGAIYLIRRYLIVKRIRKRADPDRGITATIADADRPDEKDNPVDAKIEAQR